MDIYDARLFDQGNDSSISPEITRVASRYPESFLNHLRAAWEKDGARAAEIPAILTSLQSTLVLCEDGVKRPLSTTYLPTRRLRAAVEKFIQPDDNFPFLQFQKFWSLEENADAWAFLSSHLSVGNDENLDLYLDILKTIRAERPLWSWSQKHPRRVLSLYLHIQITYGGDEGNTEKIREVFEEHKLVQSPNKWWKSPSDCALRTPNVSSWQRTLLKTGLLPLKNAWDATEEEHGTILQFFRTTLGIIESPTYFDLICLLRFSQTVDCKASQWEDDVRKNYEIINDFLVFLSDHEKTQLRSAFIVSANIAMRSGDTLQWYKQTECIWCPGLQSSMPGYLNLSEEYKGLEDFFVGFLGVKEPCASYEKLLQCEPTSASIDTVKETLLTLSAEIMEMGGTLDLAPLLSKKILPVRGKDGKVRLCTADADFYIIDRPHLNVFRNTIQVLDFSVCDIARLVPFLEWAELESHYLSWNVKESSFLQGSYPTLLDGRITTEKARGLLRIASHYRSPRTKTLRQRQLLLKQLEGSRFVETAGIFRKVELMLADGSQVVRLLEGQLHIVDEDVGLRIYVPREREAQELSAVSLPRFLVQWLMTDPGTDMMEAINEVSVSLVKSISNVRDVLIQKVLTEEGVIPFERLIPSAFTNFKPRKRIPVRLPKPASAEFEACPEPAAVKPELFTIPGLTTTQGPSENPSTKYRRVPQPISARAKVSDDAPALSEIPRAKTPVKQHTPVPFKLPETFVFQFGNPSDPEGVRNMFSGLSLKARKDAGPADDIAWHGFDQKAEFK